MFSSQQGQERCLCGRWGRICGRKREEEWKIKDSMVVLCLMGIPFLMVVQRLAIVGQRNPRSRWCSIRRRDDERETHKTLNVKMMKVGGTNVRLAPRSSCQQFAENEVGATSPHGTKRKRGINKRDVVTNEADVARWMKRGTKTCNWLSGFSHRSGNPS